MSATAWNIVAAAAAFGMCMAAALWISGPAMASRAPAAPAPSRSPAAPAPTRIAARPAFDEWWHDGKAELDGYRYEVTRYGQRRRGQCVAVYVTEPFSRSKNVKVDDASRNPQDVVDVLKLNLVRDFQTGIYDYNTMTSLFVRTADFEPVKLSFASTEWCGNVYEELRVEPGRVSQKLSSYFEDESGSGAESRPNGGILEEELFVKLRGLGGQDFLAPGMSRTVPLLPSAFRRRLAHRPLRWGEARITRLPDLRAIQAPAGRIRVMTYQVKIELGAEGLFFVEAAYPHRVVRWEWRRSPSVASARAAGAEWAQEGDDSGELTGSARLEYWKLHDLGDERYLAKLGLR